MDWIVGITIYGLWIGGEGSDHLRTYFFSLPSATTVDVVALLKRLFCNADVRVVPLKFVNVEQPPLRKGTLPISAASSGTRWASG